MFGTERRSKNKLVQGERDRIKKDEEMTGRIAELESIRKVVLRAEFECATQSSSAKGMKLRELRQQRENQLALQALTLVRRAALSTLMQQEEEQYSRELRQRGLVIYQQRV
ncbi:hypothetical protein AALO_G00172660 [Alosa alosa]|uniref:Uncharacterized protein n=1 Tax=Alosa alosa TaxID=278164 RepID=A0AAV6G8A3_9TELE|nr:hypothetical protein AALO_G00172660 [Alosa alosa]